MMKKMTCPFCNNVINFCDDNIPEGTKYEVYCKNCTFKAIYKKIDFNKETKK